MRWVRLEECCTIQGGGTPKRNVDSYWGEGFDWFTPKDLSSLRTKEIGRAPEQITAKGLSSCSAKLIPANSLLLSSRAPIGHLAITSTKCCTNQGFQSLIPKDGIVDVGYLYFVMKWSLPRLRDMGRGATFKEISKTMVKGFQIPLPPLEEQKRIAGILDEADLVRKKTQALIDKYDELAQSLFLDMFGDPVTNPKGWEVRTLREVVHEDSELSYGIVQPGHDVENGVPMVRPVDFTQKTIQRSECKTIDPEIAEFFKRTKLKGGELLLTVRGTVGLIAKAHLDLSGGNVSRGVVPFFLKENHDSDSEFIISLFQNSKFNSFVNQSFVKGATLKGWNLKDLRMLEIIWPPLKTRQEWSECIGSIQAQRNQAELTLSSHNGVFNALLQKAFKGELT